MSKRRKNDFYPTERLATEMLLDEIGRKILSGDRVLEPCAGQNHMLDVLIEKLDLGVGIIGTDIDPETPCARLLKQTYDAKAPEVYQDFEPDWVITNPPFNQAIEIAQQAREHSRVGVALLLRLSFLEPTFDRGPWLAIYPPTTILVLPRMSFTQDGKTDSVTCAWMIWEKINTGQKIKVISKGPKPEKRKRKPK